MGMGSRLLKLPLFSWPSFLLVLVSIFSIISSWCPSVVYGKIPYQKKFLFFDKIHVYVYNELGQDTPLNIHCKSKDDDLGEHKLSNKENFNWSFRPNLAHTTLFWCTMWWQDSNGRTVQASNEVYRVRREWGDCGSECIWLIRKDGWYVGPSGGENVQFRYPWK
ncbi:Plant self-incompatibility S1 [Macleaya cordata]|uniref:S-protein homolog n=1 Tax=Macleaya cordata TaxID=56857 RepID=A0A200R743_MACCD|nr:Plant self-incompatibility S1 [Macleaya cordata]